MRDLTQIIEGGDDAWDQAREFELFDPEYPVEELEA